MQNNTLDNTFTEQRRFARNLIRTFSIPLALLLIPLTFKLTTTEFNWTPSDFLFAYVLLAAAGLAYTLITKKVFDYSRRLVIGFIVFFILMFLWVGAATGFEGVFDRLERL